MHKGKIIFDTDPGIDDAMALLFAHYAQDIEIVGITTVLGNGTIETVTSNALYICERFTIPAPVYQGAAAPLLVAADEPPAFVHGDDGLGNIQPTQPTHTIGDQYAAGFIVDTILQYPHEITLVAVGRLTNLAMALRINPEIASLVKEVVIMGGALGSNAHTGNVTPVAEANIFGDPHAADIVVTAPWPVTLVGLDVTMDCIMLRSQMQRIRKTAGAAGEFIWDISRHYEAYYYGSRGVEGFPMHDSCAVAYLLAPELFEVKQGTLRVATEGITRGQTILVPPDRKFPAGAWEGMPMQSGCVGIKPESVLALYEETLCRS
jgi:inosine-uridine nucleoside N-ribohydrolase